IYLRLVQHIQFFHRLTLADTTQRQPLQKIQQKIFFSIRTKLQHHQAHRKRARRQQHFCEEPEKNMNQHFTNSVIHLKSGFYINNFIH
ncbi:MAG TPA: hypothetical protein PKC41_12195, partial [Chitinophagaceae bacterium]|nr:hypothetical protein [Chitinophagaceae bacterium]